MEFIFNEDGTINVNGITNRDILWPHFEDPNPNFYLRHHDEELHEALLSMGIDSKESVYTPSNGGEEEITYRFKISFGHYGRIYLYSGDALVEVTENNADELGTGDRMIRIDHMNLVLKPRPSKNDPSKMIVNIKEGEAVQHMSEIEARKREFLAKHRKED